jgi:hypothetical protein
MMAEVFSEEWCRSVNEQIAANVTAIGAAGPSAPDDALAAGREVKVLVRLRTGIGAESCGIMRLSPMHAPFIELSTFDEGVACDVEVEMPEQVLGRISGKPVAECRKDVRIPAMVRVHAGMDLLVELAYKHRYSSPIRRLQVPALV